jgi:hypothetical protein
VRRIVRGDGHTEPNEVGRALGICVAPRDLDAAANEQLSERAHARAGYSDKVERTRGTGINEGHWGAKGETDEGRN